ncbi:electron transfer flavoprotein subunit alpha/FixB family protein [Halalkalibacter urbisdiaboli]|uniref:electron transfer flavoprotein subunit alpha/FixB family protein n=1 Tax=Halalkalibacter urbisdiaboli TaxID=1960589 RepID=UPI000B43BC58|nr:electron transfer flavoprotein subunit alpha/FixB family protein [Halalkalibacter urbisdiaboli]
MSKTILVVAEHRDGALRQVTYEAIEAAKVSSTSRDQICLAIIGSQLDHIVTTLSDSGVEKIYVVDHEQLKYYQPEAYASALKQVIDASNPRGIIFGHTAIGRDLAPMIAASLDAGQVSDVINIGKLGEEIVYTRPIFAGKAFEQKKVESSPWVVTIRPNNITIADNKNKNGNIEKIAYNEPSSLQTKILEVVQKTSAKVDLSEAKIIIAGGRGVKSTEGFQPLEELADLLGGAVGASRGACDAGYCDYSMQIGQTGKVVTPEIYIACGISGAIQHVAGMSQSRIIIAINKDADAPIFKIADYGIVGDLFEVIPLLTEEFKNVLSN